MRAREASRSRAGPMMSAEPSYLGANSGSSGTYKLNGGLLIVSALGGGAATSAFNFSGGTLQAGKGFSTDLAMTLGKGSGANFNTAGFNVTLSGSLSGPGSLTKVGNGTLTVAAVNTYTGGATLDAGTLSLGSSGALPSIGTIRFAGGTLQATSVNTTDYSFLFSTAGGQIFSIDTNGQTIIWGTG